MSDQARVIRHVLISGRVQGVGFRAFVEHCALRHGLEGWVRNRRDGSVEAVFAGPRPAVEATIAECRVGPPSGHVYALDQRKAASDELELRKPGELFSFLHTV
jgi:acylphosphatase